MRTKEKEQMQIEHANELNTQTHNQKKKQLSKDTKEMKIQEDA